MALSVITVTLWGVISASLGYVSRTDLEDYRLKVGGLNETELYDLKQIPNLFPISIPDVERFGAWSTTFQMTDLSRPIMNWRISEPPIESVAPFLSRIKSWGYKITFYNSYVGEVRPDGYSNGVTMTPIMLHTWILESEPVPPPPPPPPETTPFPTEQTPTPFPTEQTPTPIP